MLSILFDGFGLLHFRKMLQNGGKLVWRLYYKHWSSCHIVVGDLKSFLLPYLHGILLWRYGSKKSD